MSETAPMDSPFFQLCCDAVKDGLEYIQRKEAAGRHIAAYSDWPKVEWFDNGMPWFTRETSNVPKDYHDAFRSDILPISRLRPQTGQEPRFEDGASFRRLVDYAKAHSRLKVYMRADTPFWLGVSIRSIVEGAIDRYIHVCDGLDFSVDKLLPIYLEVERALMKERLDCDVIVPILFLKVDSDRVDFGNRCHVIKMSHELQLARAPLERDKHDAHPIVQGAATHALVLREYLIPNTDWLSMGQLIARSSVYPLEAIDAFFAGLRIVTGYATGYAQLLLRPVGWAAHYKAHLPPLEGTSIRRYPVFFEEGHWHNPVPTVGSDALEETGRLFLTLRGLTDGDKKPKLSLAIQRLNVALLRETEEDGVVDTMIGLEALLSDGNQEMTHKVATRLAGLCKLTDPSKALVVFDEAKQVYAFRSAIVHGDAKNIGKRREMNRNGGKVPTFQVAVEHLRLALRVLADHPKYLKDVKRIDRELLIGDQNVYSH